MQTPHKQNPCSGLNLGLCCHELVTPQAAPLYCPKDYQQKCKCRYNLKAKVNNCPAGQIKKAGSERVTEKLDPFVQGILKQREMKAFP